MTLAIRASKSISVDPTKAMIKANEKSEVALRVTAPEDAPLAEYTIYLQGTPTIGEATSMEFTVKVVAP